MIDNYSHQPMVILPRGRFTGPALSDRHEFGMPQRLGCLASLFALELIAFSTWMDARALQGNGKLALRAGVAFTALFLTFGYLRSKVALRRISDELVEAPIKWGLLAGHLGAMATWFGLSFLVFAGGWAGLQGNLIKGSWLLEGALGMSLAAIAVIPLGAWLDLFRSTGTAWAYASGATLVACQLVRRSDSLWQPATRLTFSLVKALLQPFLPDLVADPATATIGSHKFSVTIAPACSGIESVGLILVFSVAWLWFFRRECRFPQALLLIPAGVCILWLLNVARITTLILIGNAGAPNVAVGGFHSQAGWITFNAVALGVSLVAQRVQWFTVSARARVPKERFAENPAAAYLTPFLAILAAAMLSRAVSGTFEWLYPLRFFAAAGAVWFFWPKYAKLDWKFGWAAPVVGTLVFVLWLGLDLVSGAHKDNGIPASLAAVPAAGRLTWLVFRTLAAVVTVPIAEELAFRGFLIRRLASADFESVSVRTFTYSAVIVSSVAFGLLHGDRWLAGSVAGILYAGALLWRGRIGDAVVAHGVTNALIAVWVLFGGNWHLW